MNARLHVVPLLQQQLLEEEGEVAVVGLGAVLFDLLVNLVEAQHLLLVDGHPVLQDALDDVDEESLGQVSHPPQ